MKVDANKWRGSGTSTIIAVIKVSTSQSRVDKSRGIDDKNKQLPILQLPILLLTSIVGMPVAVFVCWNGVLWHIGAFYAWRVAPDYAQETLTARPAFICRRAFRVKTIDQTARRTGVWMVTWSIARLACSCDVIVLFRHLTSPERRVMTDGNRTCTSCEIYLRRRRRTHNRQTVVEAAEPWHLRHSISAVQQLLQRQQRRTTSVAAEFTRRVCDVWYTATEKKEKERGKRRLDECRTIMDTIVDHSVQDQSPLTSFYRTTLLWSAVHGMALLTSVIPQAKNG